MRSVVCFGDSNTYGYDPRSWLGGRYPADSRWVDLLAEKTGWDILNAGQNGREIPRRGLTVPADMDLLIVMLGTNDLLQGADTETVAEHMENFLRALELERQKILLVAPPPLQRGAWVPVQHLIDASAGLARQYRDISARLGIRFLDSAEWNVALAFDGVHFTEEGHRSFAAHLYDAWIEKKG